MALLFHVRHKRAGTPDYFIILVVAALTVFGLAMLASASSNLGRVRFDDTYHYLKHQLFTGLIVGVIGFFITSKLYYRYYEKFALTLLTFSLILLTLVFTPLGITTKGASRWLAIGPITFQPSEIVKLCLILYLAAWLGRGENRIRDLRRGFFPFLAITSLIIALLLAQPATSTTAILFTTALVMYFASGTKLRYIASLTAAVAIIIALAIYTTPYRLERITAFLNPETNVQSSGFHLSQARIAIGSGGLTGVGYGQSTTKLQYLPEPEGDSIFAVIAEELGFIGSTVLIITFAALVIKLFILSKRCKDRFGSLVLIGFATLITLQTFTHIAAISGLMPLTGTPLPFISYGGTALATFLTMSGIAVNISKYI